VARGERIVHQSDEKVASGSDAGARPGTDLVVAGTLWRGSASGQEYHI